MSRSPCGRTRIPVARAMIASATEATTKRIAESSSGGTAVTASLPTIHTPAQASATESAAIAVTNEPGTCGTLGEYDSAVSRRVLITGITGFSGSHLAEHLVARGDEVHGLAHEK